METTWQGRRIVIPDVWGDPVGSCALRQADVLLAPGRCTHIIFVPASPLVPSHYRQCGNPPMHGRDQCWNHDPDNIVRLREKYRRESRSTSHHNRWANRGKPVMTRTVERVALHWWFELAGGAEAFAEFEEVT